VEKQLRSDSSLLNFIRQLIRLRRQLPYIGHGNCTVAPTHNPAVLAIAYQAENEKLLILQNFSDQAQNFTLNNRNLRSYTPIFGEQLKSSQLPPYGFSWLRSPKD
jgi:maltose alpha-D-glucosyltransferase/alpha-amylase